MVMQMDQSIQCQLEAVLVLRETVVESPKQHVTTSAGDTVIVKHAMPIHMGIF
jgi:hypothetical protein